MNNRTTHEYSTTEFTWSNSSGSAFASDLGYAAGSPLPDMLVLTSSKTGEEVRFWASDQEVVEGELHWTSYVAVRHGKAIRGNIFND